MLGFRELPYGVTDVLSSAGYFTIIVARLLENGLQFHIDFNFRSNLGMSRGYPLKSIADRSSAGVEVEGIWGSLWKRRFWRNFDRSYGRNGVIKSFMIECD